jgi:hypothetical protein
MTTIAKGGFRFANSLYLEAVLVAVVYARGLDLAQKVMRGCTNRKRSVIEHYLS